jgi:hypothetical protein
LSAQNNTEDGLPSFINSQKEIFGILCFRGDLRKAKLGSHRKTKQNKTLYLD